MLRRSSTFVNVPWLANSCRFSSTKTTFRNPTDKQITELLKKMKTLVVVGLSTEKTKPSYHVVHEIMERDGQKEFPITLIPVRPISEPGMKLFGAEVKASLKDISPEILQSDTTVVDVFRKSSDIPPLIDELITLGAKNVWLQKEIFDNDACLKAEAKGMFVVADKCIYVEHQKLLEDQW